MVRQVCFFQALANALVALDTNTRNTILSTSYLARDSFSIFAGFSTNFRVLVGSCGGFGTGHLGYCFMREVPGL